MQKGVKMIKDFVHDYFKKFDKPVNVKEASTFREGVYHVIRYKTSDSPFQLELFVTPKEFSDWLKERGKH